MNLPPLSTRRPPRTSLHRLVLSLGVSVLVLQGTSSSRGASSYSTPAIVPTKPLSLFNGRDLDGFYTWIPRSGYADPDRVFTVVDQVDGAPAIRISGQHDGGLITRENYANYHLVVEFRYGVITWASRKNNARDSGILLHGQGEDGGYRQDFKSPWLRSVEFQIIEGGTGDLLLLGGLTPGSAERINTRLTIPVTPGTQTWNPEGTPKTFFSGRIDWFGRDPRWKNQLGFRGSRDAEKPVGEWNRLEAICAEGNLTFLVNGVKVNEGKDGNLREGRILFQSEGAEIYFRRIELLPLSDAPNTR
ncbi:MAG TPA: DUF1080 domain-containing protein [Opitutaceae bacterium]|nr:DUF1080 domain-containing protein [Opitutaceae bacterium]